MRHGDKNMKSAKTDFRFFIKGPEELLLLLLTGYEKFISPLLPAACRFYPSCSEYIRLSLQRYGLGKGIILSILRLVRCQPFCAGGVDFPEDMYRKIWKIQND